MNPNYYPSWSNSSLTTSSSNTFYPTFTVPTTTHVVYADVPAPAPARRLTEVERLLADVEDVCRLARAA